jgi:hypothetical protein
LYTGMPVALSMPIVTSSMHWFAGPNSGSAAGKHA